MKYIVFLRSCGNIDNNECPYEEIVSPRFEHAESIDECGRKVRNYIEDNCLGVDNGAEVRYTKRRLDI